MRMNFALLGAISLGVLTSGCLYTDRSEEYLRANSIPSVDLPPTLRNTSMDPLYPIPEVVPRLDAFLETEIGGHRVPRPEPMSAEREAAKVKIQKVGKRQWLLVEAPPSQVWPLAQSYLSSAGINVARSDAASGLIQTDWVQFKSDEASKSQFKVRIEKGVRPDSTEVHVLQHQRPVNARRDVPWPATSDNPERESLLLESLANSLALGIDNKAASLLGQSIGGKGKAELLVDNGEPAIALRLDKVRAWATLSVGLQKEGFVRWSEKDSLGVFYGQYTGDYKRPNWLMRLFTRDKKPVTKAPYDLETVLQHLANTPEVVTLLGDIPQVAYNPPLKGGQGYLLVLREADDGFLLKVRDYKGERIPIKRNKRLLAILRRNLI